MRAARMERGGTFAYTSVLGPLTGSERLDATVSRSRFSARRYTGILALVFATDWLTGTPPLPIHPATKARLDYPRKSPLGTRTSIAPTTATTRRQCAFLRSALLV